MWYTLREARNDAKGMNSGMKVQARWLCCVLIFTLLFPLCASAEEFTAYDAADARRKALEPFRVCAFSTEYGDEDRDFMIRWKQPIRVFVNGSPNNADLRALDAFLMELSLRVPDLPPVTRVYVRSQANMVVNYVPMRRMGDVVPDYVDGCWGMVHFDYEDFAITNAVIGVTTDTCGQEERNGIMREEIINGLGLCNDQEDYTNSAVYQYGKSQFTVSELDWIMLNFLYSPLLNPGDRWPEAKRKLTAFYGL